jgi:hypothetical protein
MALIPSTGKLVAKDVHIHEYPVTCKSKFETNPSKEFMMSCVVRHRFPAYGIWIT